MLVRIEQGFRDQADLGPAGLRGASLLQGGVSGPQVYEQGGQGPSVTHV